MFNKKIVPHFIFLCVIFSLIFPFTIQQEANAARLSSYQKKTSCQKSSGIWRRFENSCANFCFAYSDPGALCLAVMSYSCQCPENKCFDGKTCLDIKDIKTKK